MTTEEETILEDEQVNDEIVTEESEGETTDEDKETEGQADPYRSKLNATNRFLQKEGYKFENGKWVKPTEVAKPVAQKSVSSEVTALDTLAFIDAQVTNSEDIAEVMKLAKGFGLSIADALKDSTVKHRLNVLREERKTAEASNTRTAKGGARQVDSKQLLSNLAKGEVPKTGSTEAEELYWARRGGRRS